MVNFARDQTTQDPDKKVMIHVQDLWKRYGSLEVLRGITLDIFRGETIVVLGRSGVGKSVLLRQIIGIEKPDKGYVLINNERIEDIRKKKKHDAKLKMGMLFQGSALFDSMSVEENVAFYLRQHENLSDEEIKDRVEKALRMVNLAGTQSKMPSDLSGGMRKRVALARLIVYRPSIILYDEPTTGLDPITANQINELINATQRELHATSVVVTHDIRSALEIGDRLAFHHDGKIAHIADKETFLRIEDPNLRLFLENASTIPNMHKKD